MKKLLTFCIVFFCAQLFCAQSSAVVTPSYRISSESADVTVIAAVGEDSMSEAPTDKGQAIVERAMKYLGCKYVRGHAGPKTFDCSGFTSYVYRKENISITRTPRSQFSEGKPVRSTKDLKKGDLVFFGGSKATRTVGHVGIVTEVDASTGYFKFVHASRRGVRVDNSTTSYYAKRYLGARRIIN